MPKGIPHPPEVKDRALDLIAKDAAANGGKVPFGSFQRAADTVGAAQQTVWEWWDGQEEEEERERTEAFTRARERLRRLAVDGAERILDHLLAKLDPEDVEAATLDDRTAVNLAGVCQRIADNDKDAADLLQTINLRVNDGDRDVPDEAPPIPDLPDLDN
ncbi:hypothetical protein HN371_08640 [Candidatus Poribacteria bacterium]|jgi:hypothetical protein|nr:hypothetical protein [Candidatus Poribacteria bacterium]MBT7098055.1 hypothetical protein [Candidatus Poribacteria bacterium]